MNNQDEEGKNKRNRSTAYPAHTLDRAIKNIRHVRDNLGVGPFDRMSVAKALGYTSVSGTSSTAVAALVHYGLLQRQGDVYRLSSLAEDILMPREEGDRIRSLIDAASKPKLFRSLLDKYGGRSVPAMLDHILVRDYGIKAPVAGDVKKVFLKTMTTAGLLENGVLLHVLDLPSTPSVAESESTPSSLSAFDAMTLSTTVPSTKLFPPTAKDGFFANPTLPADAAPKGIHITQNFRLIYDDLPLELMLDPRFAETLKDLKAIIDKALSNSVSEKV